MNDPVDPATTIYTGRLSRRIRNPRRSRPNRSLFSMLAGVFSRGSAADGRRGLFMEPLEDRTLLSVTTAYVALASDFTDTSAPANQGNPQAGDTVTWNGGANLGTQTGLIFGTNAFTSINSAIAAATSTVEVAPGTYSETIAITKPITLEGANAGIHPTVGTNSAAVVGTRVPETVLQLGSYGITPEADNITVDGFEITNVPAGTGNGLIETYSDANNFHLTNTIFNDQVAASGGAPVLFGGGSHTDLVADYNVFQDLGDASIYLGGNSSYQGLQLDYNKFNGSGNGVFYASSSALSNGVVNGNDFDGTVGGTPGVGGPGLNIGTGGNITIENNLFHDLYDTGFQVGIDGGSVVGNTFQNIYPGGGGFSGSAMQLWGGEYGTTVSTNVSITNNIIHYNDQTDGSNDPVHGIRLRGPNTPPSGSIDGSTIHINDNDFVNGGKLASGADAILNQGDSTKTVDASANWWGTNVAANISGMFSGSPVDFTPYLDNGNNSATGTSFQGDFSVLDVTPLGGQVGTTGRVQEAASLAASGGTVNVAAGTYDENSISLSKPITLDGPNAGINPNTGTRVPEAILNGTGVPANGNFIYVQANDVTINGFTVEGSTPGAGIVTGDSGGQILDNIVTNNEIGIYADSTGPTLIQGNLITGNNVAGPAGGTAIYSDATNGLTINDNVISNQTINSAITFAASSANVHKNLTVSNNSIAINAPGNSAIYVVAVEGGVFSGNDITANGGGSGIHLAGDDTNIAIHNNNLVNNSNGVSITDDGYGFGPNAGVTVNDNRFLGNTTGLNVDSGANVYSGTSLDATKNWWGDVSGPTIASNIGGDGQAITAPAGLVTYAPWLIYGTNAAPAGTPGFQLPAVVPVASLGDVSPAVNDFTLLQNAIGAAAAGQTIDLSGTFDWTQPKAAAAYAASNLTADAGHDIRGIALPDGVNNLTITSSNGTAKIVGGGDSTDGVYNSFVFSAVAGAGATGNNNLTISNLNIDNFMSGVTLGWNNGGAFNGTLVKNNTITVAADNDNNVNDVQGIAVYFWNGQNQTMTGNTIDFMGDGTRTAGTGARSLGFQDGTTGANGYQGLSIDHNIFQLLPSAIGGHETVTGIWENGHNDHTGTNISIADNQFLGIQGKRQFDIGVQLSSQSTNMAVAGNTFTDVKYVYWVGAHNGDAAGDQFTFTNNTLTRVGDANGVFLQNVASDASPPYDVAINWGTNNTIDGFTGIRGLNELSTQATGASRPTGAASDLAAVTAFGPLPADYVNGSWGTQGRFTNPLAAPDGTPGPIAFGFNTFNTIQDGVNAIDPAGTVNVLPGTYAENVAIGKNLTLVGVTPTGVPASPPTAIIQPTSGDGITVSSPATNVSIANLGISGAANAVNASGVATLNLTDLALTGNSSGGTISNVGTLNDTPLTGGTGATDTITGGTIQRGTDDTISYSNVGNLNVTGSDGSDTFNVTPAATTILSINGGLPTPPALPGDTLNVNSVGLTTPALSYTTTGSGDRGKFTFGNAAAVNFQGIETLANVSNLSITNTDDSPTPGFEVPGTPITYTIVVANNGPNNVAGATVSDVFPAGLTNIAYTATATGGATGFLPGGSTNINDTVDLPIGSTITYVVTAKINPAARGTLTNTATVSVSSPILQTATATDSDTLTPQADLSITNTDNSPTPGQVQSGQALIYTVVVTNGGPSDVTGASVTDALPAGLDGIAYTAAATGGANGYSASGNASISDTVNMPAGSTITYTIHGSVDAAATGTFSSAATVVAPLGVTDPNTANNSVTDSAVVSVQADLSITNSDNSATPGSVVPGTPLTYTIVVKNAGLGNVTGAKVADSFPAGFTGIRYTATSTGTASGYTANGGGNINDTVDMTVGSTITYLVTGTVDPAATGNLSNTASVTPPADIIDSNTANNSATDTDALTSQAHITITKTDNSLTSGSAVPGTALTYTITVSNSGPSVATDTGVSDLLPPGFTGAAFTSVANGGATGNTANGTGNISDTVTLPVGGSVVYTVTGTIKSSATGSLVNTAKVAPGTGVKDTNAITQATDSLTLKPQASLTIAQTDNSAPSGSAVPGTSVTYTITVSNSGPSVATGTGITDVLPGELSGVTFTSIASGGATGNTASGGNSINDTVTLPVGGSVVYTVKGTISASATGTLANTATVTPGAGVTDTNAATSSTDSLTLTPQANITITTTDNSSTPGSAVPGTPLTYTITVSNSGPSVATDTGIVDSLPVEFTGATFTSVASGGATGNTASGGNSINDTVTLPAGGSVVYTVKGTISASATGTLANTARVTPGAGVTDTNAMTSSTDSLTLTPQAELTIAKIDNSSTPGSAVPGTALTYTITVSNSGPSVAANTNITDLLPAGFTGATFTSVASGGATGNTVSGSNNINDTATLPVGGSVVYTVKGTISASATGTLVNKASVAPGAGITDTNAATSATDSLTLTPQADISITKTDNSSTAGSAVPGTALTYTITVSNSGPSTATGTNVTDVLPPDFTGATFTSVASGGATGNTTGSSGNINDTVTLPAGSSVVYTVKGTISASAVGTLANTAKVAPGAGVTDTNATTQVTDSLTLTPQANITVATTDNSTTAGSAVPGTALIYTITVSNSGPSVATGTGISDLLPPGLIGARFTSIAGGGAAGNTASGSGHISDTVNLPAGSFVVYTVTGTIDPAATGTLTNTANVAPGAGVTDTNATTSASDTLTLTPQANLTIVQTDNSATPGSAVPGTSVTYSITVSNSGPSVAKNTAVSDALPSDLNGVTFTSIASGGATGNTASGSSNTISDTLTLPAGSFVTYTVTGTIKSSATGTLTNTASVAPGAGVTDTNSTTSDSDSLTLTPRANLVITKTDNSATPGKAVPGDALTYTITVTNSGPSDAPATAIADSLSADLTAATFTSTGSAGVSGNTASGSSSISDTVNIPAGGSVVYTVKGTIDPAATGTLANTATVTAAAGVTDTNAATTATDNLALTPQANITITMTNSSGAPGNVVPGTSFAYTITVSNSGPSVATATSITDVLPADFPGAAFSSLAHGGATGNTAGVGDIHDTLTLPAGSSVVYTVAGVVSSTATGTLDNTASIVPGAGVTDTNTATSATDSSPLTPQADITVTKIDNSSTPGSAVPGTPLTYTITVSSSGPSVATNTNITDMLPAGFTGATFTSVASGGATGNTASGNGGINDTLTLPVGGSVVYTVAGTISASATGTLANTAKVTPGAGVTDINPTTSATNSLTLTPEADLSVTMSDNQGGNSATAVTGTVVAGTPMTYTVVVSNSGPSDVTGATVADTVPAGFAVTGISPLFTGGASITASSGSGGSIDDMVDLPAGGSITYVVSGLVGASASGALSNTATVSPPAGVPDGNAANNTATDKDTITDRFNLSVTQVDSAGGNSATGASGSVVAGTPLSYTIVVSNAGPSDVTGGTVTDALPAGFKVTGTSHSLIGGASITTSAGAGGDINDTVNLPVGGSIVYVVSGTVAAGATGNLSNTAKVAAGATTGTGTATDAVKEQVSLSITKTDNLGGSSATGASGSVVAGTPMTYTIVIRNSGPSDLIGGTTADLFPAGFTGVTYTASETGTVAPSGFTASGSGNINDTVDIPVGGAITYVASGTVASSETGTLSNTANVTLPAGATNTGDSSATDADAIAIHANVTVTETDNKGGNSTTGAKGSVPAGSPITYTVVIGNSGPSDVSGVTVADALPAGLTNATFTASSTGGASGFTASGSGNLHDTVTLPSGGSITYVIAGTIARGATGTLTNTAQVTLPAGGVYTGNTSAAVTDNLTLPGGAGYLAGVPGDGTIQTFVQNLYRELLGREPDAGGEATWIAQLQQNNTAAGRAVVVAGFMNSAEYKDHYITTLYEVFLGRAPDQAGLQYWFGKMGEPGTAGGHKGSADEKYVVAAIVGSDEFFARAGGTNQDFIQALYQDLLGRSAEASAVAFWSHLLQILPQSRDTVARLILSTPEAAHSLLDSFYPAPGGTAANPLPAPGAGVPASTYDLAMVSGLGWENLFLEGPLDNSTQGNDAYFAELALGAPWDDVQFELLTSNQFYNNANRPIRG